VWDAVLWLHLLAMAFFVGGQLFLAVAVVPVARRDSDRARLRAVARRFGWGSLVALGVLVATGAAMASHEDRWGDATLHVKLALVAVAIGLVMWHLRSPQNHAIEALILLDSLAIVWLGVALAH
jgi:uncharacterized membrane protein